MPKISIVEERPDSPDAMQLIAELDVHLNSMPYPRESRHAFSVETLLRQAVAFFVSRQDGLPVGCGGVQLFGTTYGEVKRMYVQPRYRRLGLGRLMLKHLAEYARRHGVAVLRLETGIYQTEAIALYERFGFQRIAPFGSYHEDPLSRYYEMHIA